MELLDKVAKLISGDKQTKGRSASESQKARACWACDAKFSVFVRAQPCRMCGRAYCSSCLVHSVPPQPGALDTSWLRVCTYCEWSTLARDLLEQAGLPEVVEENPVSLPRATPQATASGSAAPTLQHPGPGAMRSTGRSSVWGGVHGPGPTRHVTAGRTWLHISC